MSLTTSSGKTTVKLLCRAFGISRAAYYAAKGPKEADCEGATPEQPAEAKPGRGLDAAVLLEAIRRVVDDNPAWGVRKVWATLRRQGLRVGARRVWALMKANGLCLPPDAPRGQEPRRGHVTTELANRRWATDLTTVWTKENGLCAITLVVDSGCRSVIAIQGSKSQEAHVIMRPVEQALWRHFQTPGRVPDGLELRSDHGPQYTSDTAAKLCKAWGLEHTFAPVGRPTGNALAERTIRTLKEECIWLRDWTSLAELEAALAEWQTQFNERRPHQALGWKTPAERRAELLAQPPAEHKAA